MPVTTPAANSIAITFDQRLRQRQVDVVPRAQVEPLDEQDSAGNAIPKQTIGMCTANDSACIWRASNR